MIIGFDCVNIKSGGGVTHIVELVSSADPTRDHFECLYVWGSKALLDSLPNYSWIIKQWHPWFDKSIFHRLIWQTFLLRIKATKLKCNLLFIPSSTIFCFFRPVVTMHQNLLPFQWSELRRYGLSLTTARLIFLRICQSVAFHLSDGVIFLSSYSQEVVEKAIGTLLCKKTVIPHGVSKIYPEPIHHSRPNLVSDVSKTQLLYVSTIDLYKHQWHVVEGVALARQRLQLDLQLAFIGHPYHPALNKLNCAFNRFDPYAKWSTYHGPIHHDKLADYYVKSNIFIWASTCETFGIPLLEATLFNLPIICSNYEPMKSMLGESALYFDPLRPSTLADALELMVGNSALPQILLNRAKLKLSISSDEVAEKTFAFFRQVLITE